MFKNLFVREKYLSKIRPFYDSDVIKVITGIRRCGKSCILKTVINEMLDNGVSEEDIVYIPLDMRGFKGIRTPEQLESRITENFNSSSKKYIFIDEIQNVVGFESVVQALAEEGNSIFITGSNSYLLSSEISTKLTGRYINFEIFTLDFKEYIEMKKFWNFSASQNLEGEFKEYVLNGGFPKSLEFEEVYSRDLYTCSIVKEIFEKDVKTRNKINNVALYDRVLSFVINNYSSSFSLKNMHERLKVEGISTKTETISKYIHDIEMAKIIYECNRFDLKTKRSIAREQKYYLADMSIYFSMNTDNRISYGPTLENLVYLYLISNGFQVSIGKIGNLECDFIVRGQRNSYCYIQVAYTLQGENRESTDRIIEREFRPFALIKDAYPRIIITLDQFLEQRDGVKHLNAIELFLGKVSVF